jgi:hypothetical protein
LDYRFPYLLLDIRELDVTLRGPLVIIIGRDKVIVIIGHPVVIGQELLPVTEVGLERIGLLLGIESPCLAYSSSVEMAQC